VSARTWLSHVKRGDTVIVRNRAVHFDGLVTDATPCYLFLGKLKFRRLDGELINTRGRLRLQLVERADEVLA
jgi:hypothetical protein